MTTCKHCGNRMEVKPIGRPKKYCGDLCKDRGRSNSPKRKAWLVENNKQRTASGYHKEHYKNDREYQKARALMYYYRNRDRILEQKRDNPGKADIVEAALLKIRSGRATLDDAYDYMDQHLGFHSFEVESFIVDMIDEDC